MLKLGEFVDVVPALNSEEEDTTEFVRRRKFPRRRFVRRRKFPRRDFTDTGTGEG